MLSFNFKRPVLVAIILLFIGNINSQESALKLEEIMSGNSYIGHQPSDFQWSPDAEYIYFRWKKNNELAAPYYRYSVEKEKLERLEINKAAIPLNGFKSSPSGTATYFKAGYTIYKYTSGTPIKVYTSTEHYTLKQVSETQLIIESNSNLYALNTANGSYNQLTHFKEGNKPPAQKTPTHLEKEEEFLFKTVRMKKARNEANTLFNKSTTPDYLSPFFLENTHLENSALNHNLTKLVFTTAEYPSNEATEFMTHITGNGHARADKARNKVGGKNPQHKLYLWDFESDTVLSINMDKLTGLNAVPEFYQNYPDRQPTTYTKELIYHLHGINTSNKYCLIEIKSYDNKDRWIGLLDLETGIFNEINHQHDEKWIGGPGISGWNMVPGNVEWASDNTFFFQSEETGYSHLYLYDTRKNKTTALTSGTFEIHEANLSQDKSKLYISANKLHPGNREFYSLNIKSKELTPILTTNGNHEVILSPDEKHLLVNYSYKNKPWELYIAENKTNASLKQITESTTEKFNAYTWREPVVVTFKARDDQEVYARIYHPEKASKNGAAVFFVHGAGYLQNAHNWWSGYYREYMFNNMLCDMGFTVMDIDYRASKGYGRDFRTAIYRHMGGKDLSDYVDARDYLIKEHDIDSTRIGIYGGSYGGFITIMALLQNPGDFKCGAAIRSVTDWAHYNHPYTSNILNTPQEDPIAFKQSSPIYFAEHLQDQLLMLHGMVDDNVQYQDVVRLSQRFIELQRTSWNLIGYPVEPHGFKETTSWIDEYGRILRLFQTELMQ